LIPRLPKAADDPDGFDDGKIPVRNAHRFQDVECGSDV